MSYPATKCFTLGSVTALAGLVLSVTAVAGGGCSSTSVKLASAADAGAPDDAVNDDGGADEDATSMCKGTLMVDVTKLPWAPPSIAMGACSEKELADLVAYVDSNASATYADWKKSVTNAACNACIFGKEAAATWTPLLEDAAGELAELNVGGCVTLVAGGKADCGKAYQSWFDCRFEACSDCPGGNDAALTKCLTAASEGACKAAAAEVTTVCGAQVISDAEEACTGTKFVFEGPIRAQCIGFTNGG